jgi:hypothetical protein
VLAADVPDEREKRLANEEALVALERGFRGQALRNVLVKVRAAVVVVKRTPVHEHLLADLAVVRLDLLHGPRGSELPLHEVEDNLVAKAVVPAQVYHVAALERASRAVKWLAVRDLPEDVVSEMTEQVDALVPCLVDARRKLLPAELATRHLTLDVNIVSDVERGQVRDVLKLWLELLPPVLDFLLMVLHLHDVKVARRRHKL